MGVVTTLSQTALKQFENGCHRKWGAMWIDKSISFPINENMTNGSYFEYLCLGGGAGVQDNVTDLPRKKNGDKYISQIRIEKQADRFKRLFDKDDPYYTGIEIVGNQRELFHSNIRIVTGKQFSILI